ncbi:mannose-1-phosphate guanylyltransferase/mannose-6-phosphate isomerase [Litoribrevibacter euphylliae]|uniref:mannose-1-phosphate guanylyltransferase n=1 Tax=Litoribrevibacter euphylliae TaxID=1834034 RepID=A0ABV7HKM0_9GAMM
MDNIVPVVMAGGSGTRLWPLSRKSYPKQFLKLHGDKTMLQETIERLNGLQTLPSVIIANEGHRFLAAEQLLAEGFHHSGIILEPMGKNTAPAVALAAFHILKCHGDQLMLVLAADHLIEDRDAFTKSVNSAVEYAKQGSLVTFGIVPNQPETGYGYIKRGKACENAYEIDEFVEKPYLSLAEQYLESGEYYWNSGMFMFKASKFLEELKVYQPEIYETCKKAYENSEQDLDFIRISDSDFAPCPEDSIDYAVMENTSDGKVVPMDAGWNDIGAWSSLWEVAEKCENGNHIKGDVISHNTKDSLLHSSSRLIATVGVKDLVVIESSDAVLIADKSEVQNVKAIVDQLKKEKRSEFNFHRHVYRPWGIYDSIGNGHRYQVKSITVKPGAKLSVQMHHHRAEHWIVVKGTAKVTVNNETFLVSENESTYIPIGAVHALENPGKVPLELIEVQSGAYLGEDDIVRFEDRYGRVPA